MNSARWLRHCCVATICLAAQLVSAQSHIADWNINVTWLKEGSFLELDTKDMLIGDPLKAFLHLKLTADTKEKYLEGFADLEGHVEIKTAADALEFVRLQTSLKTNRSFGSKGVSVMEVVSQGWDLKKIVFGDEFEVRWMKIVDGGTDGIITKETAARAGVMEPKVVKTKDGFLVTRTVVIRELREQEPRRTQYLAHTMTQSVSFSGAYKVVSKVRSDNDVLNAIKWRVSMIK